MIRSTYRNLMIAVLVASFGAALFLFRQSQELQSQITDRQNDITRLNQELENAQSLNVALTELDSLTITEQTATQLDILRHLGLEQSDLDFALESREVQGIGNTNLYIHNVRISAAMPYPQALGLLDRLQNTKKIVLGVVEINAAPNAKSAEVNLQLTGKIYGLDKTPPPVPVEAPPAETPPSAAVSAATDVSGVSVTYAVSATAAAAPAAASPTMPEPVQ